ncbi:MAG: GntR family transcriptional regulator [Pirellulales bacterium]|nr:GntR family transcriptional regulator [Pirellulales bacterium]
MIIDAKSNVPIYQQIVQQTRDAIEAGVYRPGETLPSLRALAMEIRVNPNTVQRAYVELERLGVIESRRGLGVFVIDQKGKAARGKAERQVITSFRQGILLALESGTPPARVRELFESSLHSLISKPRVS